MKNWKTTSSGIAMICAGVISLYFSIQNKTFTEVSLTTSIASILGGVGLVFGADAPKN